MTFPAHKLREIVFLLLYSSDLAEGDSEALTELLSQQLKVAKSHIRKGIERMSEIQSRQKDIDALISKETHSYEFKRIHSVERNLLRVGVYELLYDEEIPPKVAISEAMRLAKKFGTPASVAFINAIMDHLYKLSIGEKSNKEEVAEALNELVIQEEIAEKQHDNPDVDPKKSELE